MQVGASGWSRSGGFRTAGAADFAERHLLAERRWERRAHSGRLALRSRVWVGGSKTAELIADIAALRAKQSAFLLALSAEAKENLMKLGTGNMALEAIIRTAATENPGELSASFPLPGWDQDRAFGTAYSPAFAAAKSSPATWKTPSLPPTATDGRMPWKPTAT